MKRNAFLALMIAAGLGFLLYPGFSDRWNKHHQSGVILDYVSEVAGMDENTYGSLLDSAREYNRQLAQKGTHFAMTDEEMAVYDETLNITDDGIMGYISIGRIGVELPIYHGTDVSALQAGAGHVEWSSLPVAEQETVSSQPGADKENDLGSHCVLSGHRGLPGSKLFTDLDRLEEGDIFTLHVLGETIAYRVDQISVVVPEDVSGLCIVPGMDLCTLVTCTPYGINTHRLLVRGRRVLRDRYDWKTAGAGIKEAGERKALPDPAFYVLGILAVLLMAFYAGVFVYCRRRRSWIVYKMGN